MTSHRRGSRHSNFNPFSRLTASTHQRNSFMACGVRSRSNTCNRCSTSMRESSRASRSLSRDNSIKFRNIYCPLSIIRVRRTLQVVLPSLVVALLMKMCQQRTQKKENLLTTCFTKEPQQIIRGQLKTMRSCASTSNESVNDKRSLR